VRNLKVMDNLSWSVIILISLVWFAGAMVIQIYIRNVESLFISINLFAVVIATNINLIGSLQRVSLNKIDNSFKYIERWDGSLILEARKYTRELLASADETAQNKILQEIRDKPELKSSIVTVFNFWQEMYLSIEHGRVDETILKRGFSEAYKKFYSTFKCWREEHIKKVDQKGYVDLESLHKRWLH